MTDNLGCHMDIGSYSSMEDIDKINGTAKHKVIELFHISGAQNSVESKDSISICPLRNLPKRPSVDIEFSDISYSVYDARRNGSKTTILQNLKGRFKSGELVGIMGPSGAGKSTLMDVLAGYKISGLTGTVLINKKVRSLRQFRKISCYIMQAGQLLPHLSVFEAMIVAAHLKLGKSISTKEKKLVINEILETLGLTDCMHTRCCHLSGGQKKRVSIALELVNNPPVMFLDEPTSGLDSSSCFQCISLLKSLSHGGRTIICTIHQPSARLFEMFDQIYTLANGRCIYQGPVQSLVPFLGSLGLQCPSYHNPADFMMEVASGEHGCVQSMLTTAVNNSQIFKIAAFNTENNHLIKSTNLPNGICNPGFKHNSIVSPMSPTSVLVQSNDSLSPAVPDVTPSTLYQFNVLLKRIMISTSRDQTLTQLRIVSHVLIGILIGLLYYNIGNEASNVANNSGCIFFTMLFLMFSSMMPTILTFPLEMAVFTREHLNHWYTLKSLYLAKTSADIPFQVVFTVVYVFIVYWMTNQPQDLNRFGMFVLVSVLTALVAQSVGLLVGAALSVESGTYFGPVSAIPCVLFSGFFVTIKAIPYYLQWATYLSYIRFGYEGCMLAIYGFNRPRLKCSEAYCHFRNPEKFLEELQLSDNSFWVDCGILLAFFVVLRTITYFVLRWKIQSWT